MPLSTPPRSRPAQAPTPNCPASGLPRLFSSFPCAVSCRPGSGYRGAKVALREREFHLSCLNLRFAVRCPPYLGLRVSTNFNVPALILYPNTDVALRGGRGGVPLLRLFEIRELPLVRCVPLNLALSATGEQRQPPGCRRGRVLFVTLGLWRVRYFPETHSRPFTSHTPQQSRTHPQASPC